MREVRSKRKYESEHKKKNKIQNKDKKGDNNSCCLISITGIGGAIIIIITIIFTVIEIMNNKNTSIIAYPVNYNDDNDDNNINDIDNNKPNIDYVYPRISLDEVRAEIEKARLKEKEEAKELIKVTLENQLSYIASDFPSDANFNEKFNMIDKYFKDTEFYERYRKNGDIEYFSDLSLSYAIYDTNLYQDNDLIKICVEITDRVNGYGYRNWRDGQLSFMTQSMDPKCSLSIHWGSLDICPPQNDGIRDVYNVYEILYYNNDNFVASHQPFNSLTNTEKYSPITTFNKYLAGRAFAYYSIANKSIVDHANENIMPSNNNGVDWPQTANTYDLNLNIIKENVIMNDQDIDKEFAELIGWNGAIYNRFVLKFYGLHMEHLRYKYRKSVVDFIEENWKNKFVISYHVQMGNNGNDKEIDFYIEQITKSYKYILNNIMNDIENDKDIVLYISTDCGKGQQLNNLINKIKENVGNDVFDVLIRDEYRLEYGKGTIFTPSKDTKLNNMEECVNLLSELQIDADLLGLSDILVLPSHKKYGSTFTRMSRVIMMKRHKIICLCNNPNQYLCKNFDSKESVSFTLE